LNPERFYEAGGTTNGSVHAEAMQPGEYAVHPSILRVEPFSHWIRGKECPVRNSWLSCLKSRVFTGFPIPSSAEDVPGPAKMGNGVKATMLKDDIQLLYEYDRWANNRVLRAVSALSVEEFTRDLGGSFDSVRGTLVHIVGSEWGWLTCWKEPAVSSAFVTDLWTRQDVLFSPTAFPDFFAVQLKWAEVEREQFEFVSQITDESLGRMLPIGTTQISLAHLMQHLANHSTYHRGQVAHMMRQLAAEPCATDFAMFLMERACES
jgi:uncharacterized damage-inducible protein DinB